MRHIVLSCLITICLLFVGTSALRAEELKLPKEMLGYWEPYSDDLHTDFNIKPNGIIEQRYIFGKKERLPDMPYKIIKVEDKKVFLIVRNQFSETEKRKYPELRQTPWYDYMVLEWEKDPDLKQPLLSLGILGMKNKVTEKDWNSSINANWKRIENGQSPYGSYYGATYAR